jgi:hypothetical protein
LTKLNLFFDPDENLWVLQLPGEWFGYTGGASECAYITEIQLTALYDLLRRNYMRTHE